jgi:S1-C subfamily serine protease
LSARAFHTGDGYVLTNRHVVQPWLADERAQSLTSTVNGKPRLKKLMAFFPDSSQSITLKYKQAATGEDVAVCTIDPKDLPAKLPVLPLERESESVAIGRIVVTMGYPSGPERLLAMLPEDEARGIQSRYGSYDSLLTYLAQTKHVHPLMTQGNITDLDAGASSMTRARAKAARVALVRTVRKSDRNYVCYFYREHCI